jgi:small-conductance mechanosensitive channel
MLQVLESLENTGFLTWVREAPTVLAYPTILAFHAFGMAFLVGLSAMIALRVLGFASGLPLAPLDRFFNLIWIAFWVNAVSGVVLFAQAATGFSTNVTFYLKMLAVACAVVSVRLLRNNVFGDPASVDTRPVPMKGKILAVTSLVLWGLAVLAGRLTAYSSFTGRPTALAVLIVTVVILVARYVGARILGSPGPAHQARVTTSI